jgi:exosome complex RNA-binding protein Csl4
VLEVGHAVLGRVLRLTSKQAHVEILAVGEQALRQACQGIIKKEDVRKHDVRGLCFFFGGGLMCFVFDRTPTDP